MSDAVTLSLRGSSAVSLEMEGVTADRCAGLTEADIARLPIWHGRDRARVGDFFTVRGGHSSRLRVEGALTNVDALLAGTTDGEVRVEGAVGSRLAAGMSGGRVYVHGSAGDDAGLAMSGGLLRIEGNAGHRLGGAQPGASKGMTGGEIIVSGSAGTDAASCLRRGLIVVGGSVGTDAARAMIAGTLVVFGAVGESAGRGNKRGSVVALGPVAVPVTYRYACTFDSTYVRFLMTYLTREHGLAVAPRIMDGPYQRYCGDAGKPGKGEFLVLAEPAARRGD